MPDHIKTCSILYEHQRLWFLSLYILHFNFLKLCIVFTLSLYPICLIWLCVHVGSGDLAALAMLEDGFKPNLEVRHSCCYILWQWLLFVITNVHNSKLFHLHFSFSYCIIDRPHKLLDNANSWKKDTNTERVCGIWDSLQLNLKANGCLFLLLHVLCVSLFAPLSIISLDCLSWRRRRSWCVLLSTPASWVTSAQATTSTSVSSPDKEWTTSDLTRSQSTKTRGRPVLTWDILVSDCLLQCYRLCINLLFAKLWLNPLAF